MIHPIRLASSQFLLGNCLELAVQPLPDFDCLVQPSGVVGHADEIPALGQSCDFVIGLCLLVNKVYGRLLRSGENPVADTNLEVILACTSHIALVLVSNIIGFSDRKSVADSSAIGRVSVTRFQPGFSSSFWLETGSTAANAKRLVNRQSIRR